MIPQLNKYDLNFPNPNEANTDGILAWGGDLTPSRLIRAYENGIFPWYNSEDPIIWWSPNPRLIMELKDFKISKSLKKVSRNLNIDLILTLKRLCKNVNQPQEMIKMELGSVMIL